MSGSRVLLELVIVLGTAALVTIVFQALRLPVVLGYVLAGLLIGPHVPVPLVANAELVHVLSELGVILLMFTIGLELRLSTIRRVGLPAGLTALFEVAFAIALGTLVARLLGFDPVGALFAGACLGISSTMLVAKAFEELGWKGGFTEVVFAILVFEDLIAIVLLVILAAVAGGSGLAPPDIAVLLAKLAAFLALILVGGLLIVPRSIRWIAASARSETLMIAALALCFGVSAIAQHAGYSVALGAFLAGVLIAESGHGHDVFEKVRPLRDVFAMVFFVSVGMTIEPAALWVESPRILALTAVVLLAKPIGVSFGALLAGTGLHPGVRAGVSLAQVGELSFVIATIIPKQGIPNQGIPNQGIPNGEVDLLAIAVGISCITTLTSPLLIRNSDAIATWVGARLPKRIATFVSFYESWLARLRERRTLAGKYRRPVFVLIADVAILIGITIAASVLGPDVLADLGVTGDAQAFLLVIGAIAAAAPFGVSAIRRVARIAHQLAAEVIPADPGGKEGSLTARAPRRAMIATLEVALGLAICIPAAAAIQPFVPASPLVIGAMIVAALLLVRRSIADFEGHVRAGSELVLELLATPAPAVTLEQMHTILPGFNGVTSLALSTTSPALGRSLADLDLRARTGATVLAIARDGGGLATPSPSEPLRAGDVLALAGSDEAVAAARGVLEPATAS